MTGSQHRMRRPSYPLHLRPLPFWELVAAQLIVVSSGDDQSRNPTQVQSKQANRCLHDRTTPAVRPMRPSMVWTPAPRRYGTPQRTHLRGLGLAISKKRPYLTGQVLRRKSERGDRHALAQGAGESQQQNLLRCGLDRDRVSGRVDCPAGFAFSPLN